MAKKLAVDFQRSDSGLDKEEDCISKYADLLLLWAVARAKRRGSRTLDESDFDNAHRELLQSAIVDWPRQLIGVVVLIAAGGFASWGVGYWTRPASAGDGLYGFLLTGFAVALGLVGGFLQFWPHWNK